jgi:hypothetical protein
MKFCDAFSGLLFTVCWTKRNRNLSMVVGVDTGDDGNDGNDSDESMWSLPVRACGRVVRVPRARLND